MDSRSSGMLNQLDLLAEGFAERYRRGERPSLQEYVDRYPHLADPIRDLFPALAEVEQPAVNRPGPVCEEAKGTRAPPLRQVADYRIVREIGRGGMGVVYEAEQVGLRRRVALKILSVQALGDAKAQERFRHEARAAARLHHTNIVPVFEVGQEGDVCYYAMQLIQGQGLDQVVQEVRRLRKRSAAQPPTEAISQVAQSLLTGRWQAPTELAEDPVERPLLESSGPAAPSTPSALAQSSLSGIHSANGPYFRSVARVGQQIALALAHAHVRGIVHRDVKPSNLLLDECGVVWVTDFGLAKTEDDNLTRTGDLPGTLRYMSPERFEGQCDARTDIYSLGLTLYEMLTLRPGFDDTNKAKLVEKVLRETPPAPRKIDPSIPRDLETIVLKCLAKEPAQRYATAEALAEELQRFLTDRPIKARRTSRRERTWRWCRRNPTVAGLLATVAVLLVAVASVSTFAAARLKTALGKTQQAEREARLREAEALVGQAHGTRLGGQPGRRFEALDALGKAAAIGRELGQPPEWFDRLRNEAIAALALTDIHIIHSWEGLPPGTRRADVSYDFELYARTDGQGACTVLRVADDAVVARLPGLGEDTLVCFGPGRLLVLHAPALGRWQLWDLSAAEPIRCLETEGVFSYDFRPDGRRVALCDHDGSVRVYVPDTGVCRHRLAANGITKRLDGRLHPSAAVIACFSYFCNTLQIRDLESGAVLVALTLPWSGSGGCAWSPDGNTLAVPDGNGGPIHLYRFDVAARSLHFLRALSVPSGSDGLDLQFNPAGDRLLGRGWSCVVHLFDVPTGRLLFSTFPLPPTFVDVFPWKRLAAARVGAREERIGLLSVADGREYRALVHDGAGRAITPLALHSGGRLAARVFPDGLALFDLESGREVAFAAAPLEESSICFDGAGSLVSNGFAGCFRWPVRHDPVRAGRLTIGPAERLPFCPGHCSIAASRDGKVMAQAMFNGYDMGEFAGGWVLHPAAPKPRHLDAGAGTSWASVSSDGRWVAFGQHALRVNVYEAATGRRVWQSAADGHPYCRFSPDGRWLATENDGGRLYRVGTWEPGTQLGPGCPWDISADGQLAVMGMRDGVHRLVELATGRELAQLEPPARIASAAFFTPDGTRLVTDAADGLRVWDLRRIRAELTKLGLDWDAAPYPEVDRVASEALEVRLVGADQIPFNATVLNRRAWRLVTGPVVKRDPVKALQMIQEAVRLEPKSASILNTLGVIQYRNGQYKEAVATLEKGLAGGQRQVDASDLFFLAMSHAKLGDGGRARDCFERAVKSVELQKNLPMQQIEELKAFRAEAEEILGNGPRTK